MAASAGTTIYYWETAGYAAAASLLVDYSSDRLYISHDGISAVGTTLLATNVTYFVWVEWTKGTGSDGTMKVFLSTNAIKPALPEASLNTGSGGAIERMYIGSVNIAANLIVDTILISDEVIGSDPDGNTAPTISDLADQTINEDSSTGPVSFTVGDAQTAAADLSVAGASSNQTLVPDANIVFGGSDSNRTVTVTPVANQSGSAVITVTVSDGLLSTNDTFTLTVNAVNDPPVVTLPAGTASYTENTAPVLLDVTATVADIDSPDLAGGSLTVDFTANGSPDDRLAVRHQGTSAGEIGVSGADVSYEGVTIGSFTGGDSGSSPLVISLNASATPLAAQALLRNITFHNVSEIPSTLPRTARAILNDGDGANSAPVTLTVTVTAVPDDPILVWSNPAAIVYGAALGAAQLNATAGVPGTFAYTPAAGAVLNAGNGQTLSVVFTPTDTVNYLSATTNVTLSVTPAPLAATADNQGKLYGAALPALTGTLTGVQNGDNLTATFTTLATAASPAGSYPIVPVLADPGNRLPNYAVTLNNGALTVSPAPLLITAQNKTKVYGAANPPLTAAYAGFVNGDGAADLDTPVSLNTAATAASPVGSYAITAGAAADLNSTISFAPGTLAVTPAALLITASDTNRPAGQTNPLFTVTYAGFANGDDAGDLGGTLLFTTPADTNSPAGQYPVTPSGLSADNYTLSYAAGLLTVTGELITPVLTWVAPDPIVYGTPLGAAQLNATADVPGTFVYAPAAGAILSVGEGRILTATFTPNDPLIYRVVSASVVLSVTPAPLVATADNLTKLYGASLPALTGALAGVQNGDNLTATFTTTATAASAVGSYSITPVLADPDGRLSNYFVILNDGLLTVTPSAPLTLTIISADALGNARLRIISDPGQRIKVQASIGLSTWADLATLNNATGTIEHFDPGLIGRPHRFYRAVLAPE